MPGPISSGAVSSYVTRIKGKPAKRIMNLPYQTMKNLNQCAILWRLNRRIAIIVRKGNMANRQYNIEKIRILT
ncbi:MAG: hypothetical protein WAX69_24975 [Victivallales bacterium]